MDKQSITRDFASRTFLTFGGTETFLLFVQQYPLREFCAFEVLDDETGLPQENAYDVVYRHALGNSGDALAFGSTTGNLYVSENRGDSWRVVATNLPPIYSVRFG